MPSVPPAHRPEELEARWFVALTEWAERSERGVFVVFARLMLVCGAVLALLWWLG